MRRARFARHARMQALPGLAALLACCLALEWLAPAPRAGVMPAPALPAPGGAAQDGEAGKWAAEVLARPLFAPGRRPDATAQAKAANTLPRLAGIIVSAGTASAIFMAPGQKPQIAGMGGQVGAYAVQSIDPDEVRLRGPQGVLALHPQFPPATARGAARDSAREAAQAAIAPAAPPPSQPPPPGPGPGPDKPLPRATPTSNPALYLEQNF